MPDYQKAKIYKLWSPSKNLVYYGSTVQTLSQRLADHNAVYNKNKIYCYSYLVLECEDYKMELVEEYPCNNKQQLLKKEAEYITSNICVNKKIPARTREEYKQDNKEKIKIAQKNYYDNNTNKRIENANNWNKNNRDRINSRRKILYQENK
jgi:predicted transcriptional regulator